VFIRDQEWNDAVQVLQAGKLYAWSRIVEGRGKSDILPLVMDKMGGDQLKHKNEGGKREHNGAMKHRREMFQDAREGKSMQKEGQGEKPHEMTPKRSNH